MNRRRFLKTLTGLLAALPFVGAWTKPDDKLLQSNDEWFANKPNNIDGVTNWSIIEPPSGVTELIRVEVGFDDRNTLNIYAYGSNGQVFYTADEGLTWEEDTKALLADVAGRTPKVDNDYQSADIYFLPGTFPGFDAIVTTGYDGEPVITAEQVRRRIEEIKGVDKIDI